MGTDKTDLRFIGKVENFVEDIERLKKVCSDHFEPGDDQMISHQMAGYGWAKPSSWFADWELYQNWIETAGQMPIYNYWKEHGNIDGILPPAYFAVDEATYKKIVAFYIQDIRCFGYEHQIPYQNFLDEQLNGHPNIYEDPRYNYERTEK